jgi:ribosomal protein L40E
MNGYWKLYAKIFNIPICRKCGVRLTDTNWAIGRGYLCKNCSPYNKVKDYKSQENLGV